MCSPREELNSGEGATRLARAVERYLNEDVSSGDVVVAYQTDILAVVGYCTVTKITGQLGDRKLWLQPIELVDPPLKIHEMKAGTPLESSIAVNGPVMLRELSGEEMKALLAATHSPSRVLKGKSGPKGFKPHKA